MIQKEENTLLQKQGLESRAEADERRRVYLTPTAVIWEAGRVSGSKALLENRSVQVGLHNSDCCTLTTTVLPPPFCWTMERSSQAG